MWSQLPFVILRLIVLKANDPSVFGRCLLACREWNKPLSQCLSLWQYASSNVISQMAVESSADARAEKEERIALCREHLNQYYRIKQRIRSGKANVESIFSKYSPYVKGEREDSAEDDDDYNYHTFSLFRCEDTSKYAIIHVSEESGSSWSMRFLTSAAFYDVSNVSKPSHDIRYHDEDAMCTVSTIVGDRWFLSDHNVMSGGHAAFWAIDSESGEKVEFNVEEAFNLERELQTFSCFSKSATRPWLVLVSLESEPEGQRETFLSIFDLDTGSFLLKRYKLPGVDNCRTISMSGDYIFLSTNKATSCWRFIGDTSSLELINRNLINDICVEVVTMTSNYVVCCEPNSRFGSTEILVCSFPEGSILWKRTSVWFSSSGSACGPFLTYSTSDEVHVVDMFDSNSNKPLIVFDRRSQVSFLTAGKWLVRNDNSCWVLDFESPLSNFEPFINCIAMTEPKISKVSKVRLIENCEAFFVEIPAFDIVEAAAQLLKCDPKAICAERRDTYPFPFVAMSKGDVNSDKAADEDVGKFAVVHAAPYDDSSARGCTILPSLLFPPFQVQGFRDRLQWDTYEQAGRKLKTLTLEQAMTKPIWRVLVCVAQGVHEIVAHAAAHYLQQLP